MLHWPWQEAWTSALAEFKRTGSMHRGLHEILTEIAPILDYPIPPMDPIAEQDSINPNLNQRKTYPIWNYLHLNRKNAFPQKQQRIHLNS